MKAHKHQCQHNREKNKCLYILTTLLLLISLERKVCGAERFMPSLLPRWLYDTMDVGLMPAPTMKSTSTLLIFVCPLLKSSPAISTPAPAQPPTITLSFMVRVRVGPEFVHMMQNVGLGSVRRAARLQGCLRMNTE